MRQVFELAISISHPVFEINLADPVAMNINISWEQLPWQRTGLTGLQHQLLILHKRRC